MAEATNLVGRDALPRDYLFKIESFSGLTKTSIQSFCSDNFEAGGYKWRLSIHPNGNYSKGHISIFLEILDTESLPLRWEVTAIAKFFVFNHLQNKYLSTKDGLEARYHAMNTSFGIEKFIQVDTFLNPDNGYVEDDDCVFGVEIYFAKGTYNSGCLSVIQDPATCYHTWKVSDFSSLVEEGYRSESFGSNRWYISLYPNGHREGKGNSISLYLGLSEDIAEETTLLAELVMRVKNQICEEHVECKSDKLFTLSDCNVVGWRRFMSLEKLKEGYLVDDTLIIEAEVTVIGSLAEIS